MNATQGRMVVKTSINNILCETGETHWADVVGSPTGYRPKVYANRKAAEKKAASLAPVGGRVVRLEDAWTERG